MLHTACGILVPQSGIKSTPPELEVWNLNHWDHQGSPQNLNAWYFVHHGLLGISFDFLKYCRNGTSLAVQTSLVVQSLRFCLSMQGVRV